MRELRAAMSTISRIPGASMSNLTVSSSSLFDWGKDDNFTCTTTKEPKRRTWKAEYILSPLHKFVTVIWFRVSVPVLSVASRVSYQIISVAIEMRFSMRLQSQGFLRLVMTGLFITFICQYY